MGAIRIGAVAAHFGRDLDFALQFGAFPRKIAATLKISEREATVLWQKWRHTYAGLVAWSDRQAKKRPVRNPFGRVIPRDPYRDYANGNYLIQSTGRDILGTARERDQRHVEAFVVPVEKILVVLGRCQNQVGHLLAGRPAKQCEKRRQIGTRRSIEEILERGLQETSV